MTKEEKAAYMHAYKKRMRVAKERGVDPKTLTLSDFYDDEAAKVKRLESEERLGSIGKTKPEQIERNKEALRRAARKYYHSHKKERHAYYKKNKERMKLNCFARYYADVETTRKRRCESRKKSYWKHKNDKTWWEKIILYIKGIVWTKLRLRLQMTN